jgi:hypothetical protein
MSNAVIIGTDNKSPTYNENARWQIWLMDDIYLGTIGEGKFVPKVKDMVYEISGRVVTKYIVHAIDPVTFIPTLQTEDISNQTDAFSTDDILYGVGPGTQSDTYRIYLDKSVTPYRLSVDRRLRVGGSSCTQCKIFKGTNTSNSGVVISGLYNQSGILQTENIPLEIVATQSINNSSIKVVGAAYTQFNLNDGEVVTAVFYDDRGFVVSKRQLLVENTGFVRGTDAQKKYVSGITLETPFLSTTNNKLIQYPINVPLNAMNLMGVVHYSDGSSTRLAVDGTKFSIFGLEGYSATILGQKSPLVLKYTLQANEEALNVHVGTDTFISETYEIITVSGNGNYAVKLFVYPEWDSVANQYRLKWFMYDLDRSNSFDVTQNVLINTNKSVFNPLLYGTKQTLYVSLNLRTVNGSYNNFNHVQVIDVVLNKPGSGRPDIDNIANWLSTNVSGSSVVFGNLCHSTYRRENSTEWIVRVAPELESQADWLDALYKNTSPMFDPNLESTAPVPTHFQVITNGTSFEFPISRWNTELILNQVVTNNSNIYIKFIRRLPNKDLQLSAAGTPIFQVDINGSFI